MASSHERKEDIYITDVNVTVEENQQLITEKYMMEK